MKKLLIASVVASFVLAAPVFAADSAQTAAPAQNSQSEVITHKAKKANKTKAKAHKKAVKKHKKAAKKMKKAEKTQGGMEGQPTGGAE